ncbi:acetyltransferase (GNAT) family protein [Kribbella orskensis]|uniref:Acetyltransferase (GNAT) family protein n=1 Tax=Kribbella orskensis TaxID=2512216 RepID=A0ABY2BDZ0_9ACTN|nr:MULTISPECIES: GNAT family N-acetyltransferase [Kribbella]TCN35838.1 acetyltransferase (GNAT) family protein [Kribbella sp. VKM Ac-2500]TCO17445.1 acetyltransferase (GNAT) family protein [Kribbella orskensis]
MNITSLGYRTDLMLLQLSGSEVTDKGEYVVIRTPANPTFWWGNYLLYRTPFAPGALAGRLEVFRQEFPAAKHGAFGIDTTDGLVGAEEELKAAGFETDRSTVMTAKQVKEPARPNVDSQYRFLSSDDDWEQLVGLSLAVNSMDLEGYEEFNRRKTEAERSLVEAGHAQWFGAFDGERLRASLGLVSDGSGVARFQNVQTHEDYRGRGIASTLVHQASRYGLDEMRAHTLVMVADPDYLAIRLYRALGFTDSEVQVGLDKRPS